jgi:hypothetical protein
LLERGFATVSRAQVNVENLLQIATVAEYAFATSAGRQRLFASRRLLQ